MGPPWKGVSLTNAGTFFTASAVSYVTLDLGGVGAILIIGEGVLGIFVDSHIYLGSPT